jgi:hypothetical protein
MVGSRIVSSLKSVSQQWVTVPFFFGASPQQIEFLICLMSRNMEIGKQVEKQSPSGISVPKVCEVYSVTMSFIVFIPFCIVFIFRPAAYDHSLLLCWHLKNGQPGNWSRLEW